MTVEFFLTEVILLEIRNELWLAKTNWTSVAAVTRPTVAITWQVVAVDVVTSVPIIRQFGVVVVKIARGLAPPTVLSTTYRWRCARGTYSHGV